MTDFAAELKKSRRLDRARDLVPELIAALRDCSECNPDDGGSWTTFVAARAKALALLSRIEGE